MRNTFRRLIPPAGVKIAAARPFAPGGCLAPKLARSLIALLLGLLLLFPVFASDAPPSSSKNPVAVVAGQPVYERDLTSLMSGQIQQLRYQEYELQKQTLQQLIDQKLLETEAKKRGLGVDDLLQKDVDSTIAEPSDSETEAFYLARKDQEDRPFDEIKEQLRQELKQARIQQAREEYLRRLWDRANVSILLKPPLTEMSYDPARVRGDPKAPVTIVEFADFQCPFCRQAFPIMKELLTKYAGRVKLALHDFPLTQIHPDAEIAAEAARCAGEQGKFWEYHDLLFANQDDLDLQGLVEKARSLGLDQKAFESCLASGKFRPEIENDVKMGSTAGITGTPAFFINGVLITGAQPIAVFEQAIDEQLGKLNEQPADGDRKVQITDSASHR